MTRIMIVDDNAKFLRAASCLVGSMPGTLVVAKAGSGMEALEVIGTAMPDLVLIDLNMPGMNGLESIGCIKRNYLGIKVVLISLHGGAEYEAKAKSAGADGFICKQDIAQKLPLLLEQFSSSENFSMMH